MAALTSGYFSLASLQWPWIIFFRSNFGIYLQILLLWFHADNLTPTIAPLLFQGPPPWFLYDCRDTSLLPLLPPTTYRADMLLCCTIVLSWVCGIQPGSNDMKWGGMYAFFKLETSERQNPLLFETIGSVVLSSCSFRETVGWALFFPTPPPTGCCSFAWSNWANEIPNL